MSRRERADVVVFLKWLSESTIIIGKANRYGYWGLSFIQLAILGVFAAMAVNFGYIAYLAY